MNINKWKQSGKIYIWKYRGNPRNYPGWHFSADKEGCESLIELLHLLSQSGNNTKRTISLTKASQKQCEVPTGKYNCKIETKISIIKSAKANDFKLSYDSDRLHLLIGSGQIPEFIRGVNDVLNNEGDYCIGDDGDELWFWWPAKS